MNIVAVACARDEIDIIEPFVRHTLAIVSRLVVLDNGSTDGTLAVLQALRDEGLPIDVLEDRSLGKYLSQRVTRLMREVAIDRYRADWILPLDVDEFMVSPGHGPLIPPGTSPDQPLQLRWCTYVPDEHDDPAELNPALRLRHHLVEEAGPIRKVVVPAALGCRAGAMVSPGNHAFILDGQEVRAPDIAHAYLAHLPIRSFAQSLSKAVIGYLQNEAMALRNPSLGAHHRESYELLERDPEEFVSSFGRRARLYTVPPSVAASFVPRTVDDPLPYRGGPLCFTPRLSESARTWQPILRYARVLAREYGLLKASLTAEGSFSHEQQGKAFSLLLDHLAQRDRTIDAQQRRLRVLEQPLIRFAGRLVRGPIHWSKNAVLRCRRKIA